MKCAMIGLGKLGLPVSCAMAMRGHEVWGFDTDKEKVDRYRKFDSGLHEPDFDNVLREYLDHGVYLMDSVRAAVEPAEIVFIAVPTPSRQDDSFDTCYVKRAVLAVAEEMKQCLDYKVIAIISTVLPGTVRREFLPVIEKVLGPAGPQTFGLCYNAQFIAMGTTINDMLNPEFVLIGQLDEQSGDVLSAFYGQLVNAPLLRMSIENAEMVKVCYNTMIGFKIVYANTIMALCDRIPHADCDVVSGAISQATVRLLSPRYLRGGMGDGGGCLPPGEMIVTKDGPKPIESVRPGEFVLTVDGTLHAVLGRWERDYDGELVEISVRGLPGAKFTADHRMIVAQDGRTRYTNGKRDTRYSIDKKLKESGECLAGQIDDNCLIPYPIPQQERAGVLDTPDHIRSAYIELAGWYLSEGWAKHTNRRGRIGFALHEDEIDIAARIGELCVCLDPPADTGRRKDVKVSIAQKDGSKGITVRYGSKKLAQWLIRDFGSGARDKKIPDWIVYGDLEHARLLMKGLWQGDGHANENGMSLATISQNLAWSTLLILHRLGIPATIREIPPYTGKDGQYHQTAYEVRVRNKQYLALMSEITGLEDKSPEQPKLYDLYPCRDAAYWHHVNSVTRRPYKGKVYNLWVSGNNTYVTKCGAVHNCHPRDNRALSYLAQQLRIQADPFAFVMYARDLQSRDLAAKILRVQSTCNLPVVVLGRTFKPETNLTLDSPALLLFDHLNEMGCFPRSHDPIAGPFEFPDDKPYLYVIATAHEEYKQRRFPPGSVIVDPWRIIRESEGVTVVPVGRCLC